jgi:hypothetical protein
MKRVATLVILTAILVGGTVFALSFISIPQVQAQDGCTTANFQGAFTGSEVTLDNFGKTVKCNFVIVAGGREIQAIETDNNTAVVGCLKQQSGRTPRRPAPLPQ